MALTGLAALTIYILACGTAFSPDDTKVLYPAFDKVSGQVGLAVYDREARTSQMVFLPASIEGGQCLYREPRLLRGHWLPDGRSILAVWPGIMGNDDDGLSLALLPVGGAGTFRLYQFPDVDEPAGVLTTPLPLVGDRVFLRVASNRVARLDLKTGALTNALIPGLDEDALLRPAPKADAVFCVLRGQAPDAPPVFARLDPDTLKITPLITITNEMAGGGFLAFATSGQRFALVEKADETVRLVVLERGRTVFNRPLDVGKSMLFGNAMFSPKGDFILASYQARDPVGKTASYGIIEIPLDDRPIRQTVLVPSCGATEENNALLFQAALSHDGQTVAVASTYLACGDDEFRADDCALFLVDLKDPKRKVTKVPIPLPAHPKPPLR